MEKLLVGGYKICTEISFFATIETLWGWRVYKWIKSQEKVAAKGYALMHDLGYAYRESIFRTGRNDQHGKSDGADERHNMEAKQSKFQSKPDITWK